MLNTIRYVCKRVFIHSFTEMLVWLRKTNAPNLYIFTIHLFTCQAMDAKHLFLSYYQSFIIL